MKNNTKIRLHLSKQLFESLTKQVIAEGKRNFGPGMEEVKMPSKMKTEMKMKSKKEEGMKDQMEEMSSKEKMAKGLYKEVDISDYGTIGTTPDEMKTALQVFFGIVTLLGSAAGWNWLKAHFKATPKVLQMAAKEAIKKGIEVPKDIQGGGKEAGLDEDMTSASTDLDVTADDIKKAFKTVEGTPSPINESLTDLEMMLTAGFTGLGFAASMAAAMAKDALSYMKSNNLKGFSGALQAIKKTSSSFAKSAAKRNPQTGAIEK